ncbi:uncharacterized protein LOC128556865 [Mercenaria mercenaria]|uniref:uncharacterized protein LOC128556865 n=1 Tax=Mercenaria mercenaria TaxID=6596 RepID=UPI00234F8EA0|nr:uncharacterized protein LOC128556865 [Mercenaria mercenaria]
MALLTDLSQIRNILSNDASSPSNDVQTLVTDIRSFSERVTAENKKLLMEGTSHLRKVQDKLSNLNKIAGDGTTMDFDQEKSWDDVCTEIEQIEKRVTDDLKKMDTVMKELENEINNLENIKTIPKESRTTESREATLTNKLKKIVSRLQKLKNLEEDATKKAQKQNDDLPKKLKTLEEKVNTVWKAVMKNDSSDARAKADRSNDSEKMLSDIEKKVISLKSSEEAASKKAQIQNDDLTKKLKNLEEKVNTVWKALAVNDSGDPRTKADSNTSSEKMLLDIEKKLADDKKNLNSVITEIEKEVKNLETLRNVKSEKNNEQANSHTSKLRQIHAQLMNLKNAEEAASKKKLKQKDDTSQKLKRLELLEDKVKTVWSAVCSNGASSNETDTEKMLSDIAKRQKQIQDHVQEQLDQTQESTELLRKSIECIKSKLLNKPFMFEKPECYHRRNIKDFNERLKIQLSLVHEIEDLVNENAERFSSKFVERMVVVRHLKHLFHSLCQEDLNSPKRQQDSRKKGERESKSQKDDKESDELLVLSNAFRKRLEERGITKETVDYLKQRLGEMESVQTSTEREISDLKKEKSELKRRSMQTEEKYQNELREMEKEKTSLLTRLSQMAGARLTDNNPNIADLSDPNRPTKIGEQYSELYDNQWTDAFEAVQMPDDKCLQFLLEILQDSYKLCGVISDNQQKALKRSLYQPTDGMKGHSEAKEKEVELSAVQSKALSELRKQSVDVSCTDVITYIAAKHKDWFKKDALKIYAKQCIRLCWFMHVQSPPLYLDMTKGKKLDTNKYKPYTKNGKNIAFVVWPPLLLHEGGAILSKGVAEGK